MTVKEFLESGINYNSDTLITLLDKNEDEVEFDENLEVVSCDFGIYEDLIFIEVQ